MKSSFTALVVILIMTSCSSHRSNDSNLLTEQTGFEFTNTFDYQPKDPVNGELMGIIELGSTGFNSFIINIDDSDHWRLENVEYGESFAFKGEITLDHTIRTISKFKEEMLDFGVKESQINLVVSSSAEKELTVLEITDKLRDLNMGVINVNADQEGKYALKATIPQELVNHSFLIDIGSGNTKICWVENNQTRTIETFGSKYYLKGVRHIEAHERLKHLTDSIPEKNKALCFVIGGAAFKLANQTDSVRQQRYTILDSPEQYKFEKESDLAALNLYRAVWSKETISYVFDWDTNFAIGVLMEVN